MHEIVRYLRGSALKAIFFQMVRKRQVAGNLHHLLSENIISTVEQSSEPCVGTLPCNPSSLRTYLAAVRYNDGDRQRLSLLPPDIFIGILLIINNRFFDSLSQIHAMDAVLTGKGRSDGGTYRQSYNSADAIVSLNRARKNLR